MRRKTSHWLQRCRQVGKPDARKHRQLGGKNRSAVRRHVVEIRASWQVQQRLKTGAPVELGSFWVDSAALVRWTHQMPAKTHRVTKLSNAGFPKIFAFNKLVKNP